MAKHDEIVPSQFDVNAKWDACLDLTVRRFVYSSAAGAFSGLLLFRRPVTRWASIAFGAGYGIGSAYTDCSHIFDGSSTKSPVPKISERMITQLVILDTMFVGLAWSSEVLASGCLRDERTELLVLEEKDEQD